MQQTSLFPRAKQQPRPGAMHVPDWLSLDEQQQLLRQCRKWAKPPAGLYTPKMPDGKHLSVRVLCLGWHWYPYRYSKTRDQGDRCKCKSFFPGLHDLAHRALQDTLPQYDRFEPDVAIVNWYDSNAKLGMHQDRSESAIVRNAGSPIISISLGNSCLFRFGNNQTKGAPYQDIELRSGDLFVFGDRDRMAYQVVLKIYPGTAPQALGIQQGRLNITLREIRFVA